MQALSTIHVVTQLFALRTGMNLHLNLREDYIGVSVRLLSSTIELGYNSFGMRLVLCVAISSWFFGFDTEKSSTSYFKLTFAHKS